MVREARTIDLTAATTTKATARACLCRSPLDTACGNGPDVSPTQSTTPTTTVCTAQHMTGEEGQANMAFFRILRENDKNEGEEARAVFERKACRSKTDPYNESSFTTAPLPLTKPKPFILLLLYHGWPTEKDKRTRTSGWKSRKREPTTVLTFTKKIQRRHTKMKRILAVFFLFLFLFSLLLGAKSRNENTDSSDPQVGLVTVACPSPGVDKTRSV